MTDVVKVGGALGCLLLAGDHLRSTFAAQLRVNVTELTALSALMESAELTPKQLGRLLRITTGSVTGMVDRLESVGLILRVPNPADRRSTLVLPTAAGTHLMHGVYAQYYAALTRLLKVTEPIEAPELTLMLTQTTDALSEAAEAGPELTEAPRPPS